MSKISAEQLLALRHSLAHILAAAVKILWPEVKLAIGPAINSGFYYDFDFGEQKISETDLSKIAEQMRQLLEQGLEPQKTIVKIEDALKQEGATGQLYKQELIKDLQTTGETEVSYYRFGDFNDLCKGPHAQNTKDIPADCFVLEKIAGAYWRGSEQNKMLTRIYGLAFESKDALETYQTIIKQAAERDHRKLGKELGLFTFSETVGKGLPLWTDKGATIRRELERFIVDEELKRGYKHVCTPDLARLELYKKSGHYPYYQDSMYAPITIDEDQFMLRPMACPHHFELYLSEPHSYRDLPMRLAELAKLYRYEQSGELSGLMRARGFCLADAHIICADAEQAASEVSGVLDLIDFVAAIFGLKLGDHYWYRLSLGDRQDTKKYFKNDIAWDEAENVLRAVLQERHCDYEEAVGEAAFYGPKIDVQMRNVLQKSETAFTVQYDFVMPQRFNLTYIDKDGQEKIAVVIHRSSVGAIERVVAFLIEHYAGAFPVWLSPVQAKLISVGQKHVEFCQKLAEEFRAEKIRVEVDDSDETVGNKTRKALMEKIPYLLVIGDKEVESDQLAVRDRSLPADAPAAAFGQAGRGQGEQKTRAITKAEFIKEVKNKIEQRSLS